MDILICKVAKKCNLLLIALAVFVLSCQQQHPKSLTEAGKSHNKAYKLKNYGDSLEVTFDSLGNIESEIRYSNGARNGAFKMFFNMKDRRFEVGGKYKNGVGVKEYEKGYNLKTGKLETEINFIQVDSMYWDNSNISYDEAGKLQVPYSCFLEMRILEDTIHVGECIRIECYAPCLDFEKTELVIGDFSSNYRLNSGTADTFCMNSERFEFLIPAKYQGLKLLRGYVDRFDEIVIDNQIQRTGKKLYFTHYVYVKP